MKSSKYVSASVVELYRGAMNHTILTTIDLAPFAKIKVNRQIKAMLIV